MRVIGADPFCRFDKQSGYYYTYSTSDVSQDNKTFYIHKSKDLIHYEFVGYALDLNIKNWAKDWYWAPEVFKNEKTGLYFLFYSAIVKDSMLKEYFDETEFEEGTRIGCAVSKSPEGPFINIKECPIDFNPYDPTLLDIYPLVKGDLSASITYDRALKECKKGTYISAIDADLFFEDEHIYLYFSRCCYKNYRYDERFKKFIEESNILGVELKRDFFDDPTGSTNPTIIDKYNDYYGKNKDFAVNLINYHDDPQEWENAHVDDFTLTHGTHKNRRWSEGSMMITKIINGKKKYFIFYSCNNFENALYGVGVAIADTPLGPFKKYAKNPLIHKIDGFVYSTGHGSLTEKDGDIYYVFHGRNEINVPRSIYSCRVIINDIDDIKIDKINEGILI